VVLTMTYSKDEFSEGRHCADCDKLLFYSNFMDDEIILCPDCFKKWDGKRKRDVYGNFS